MADTYGSEQIPIEPASPGGPSPNVTGDALLGWLGAFLRAVLNTNALAAWQSIAGDSAQPVVSVFLFNPHETAFNKERLPALFLWRSEDPDRYEYMAEDIRAHDTVVHVMWIPPAVGDPERRTKRSGFLNAIKKLADVAISEGRDPAWVVDGDADTQAADHGSSLLDFCGAERVEMKSSRVTPLQIDLGKEGRQKYPALIIDLDVRELLAEDIEAHYPPNEKLTATFTSPDQGTGLGDFVLGEETYD